jgi:hypothetical protein
MSAGKGDSPRSCFSREYRENWDGIFAQRRRDAKKKEKPSTLDARPSTQPSPRTVPPHP